MIHVDGMYGVDKTYPEGMRHLYRMGCMAQVQVPVQRSPYGPGVILARLNTYLVWDQRELSWGLAPLPDPAILSGYIDPRFK